MAEPWNAGPVVITGGTGLVGAGIAHAFLAAGATTIVVGSDAERAARAAAALGGAAHALAADVSEADAVDALFAEVEARHGTPAVLVNAAGINFNKPIVDTTLAEFDRVLAVNVRATFLCSRAACEAMLAHGMQGRVVNVTSGNFRYVRPGSSVYSASKAAMDMLTRGFALEYGPRGIGVNAVAPGLVERAGSTDPNFLAAAEYYRARSASQRIVTPADIGEAVLFLASSRARGMAGEVMVLDGGFSFGRLDFPRRAPDQESPHAR